LADPIGKSKQKRVKKKAQSLILSRSDRGTLLRSDRHQQSKNTTSGSQAGAILRIESKGNVQEPIATIKKNKKLAATRAQARRQSALGATPRASLLSALEIEDLVTRGVQVAIDIAGGCLVGRPISSSDRSRDVLCIA
jgi:hypothetical protein